ncbi:MAG: cysteine protease [Verrucomicrobiales bacterium]|nr:cysteine protease [Verrucomicrobiales bacterium]
MKRIKILHRTYYNFSEPVQLGPHVLRLRPREGHKLHIESSNLSITPASSLFWQSDVEDNSVAVAHFSAPTSQLAIESEVIVQQFNENPFDFLVSDYAINYPFNYNSNDWRLLDPYAELPLDPDGSLANWTSSLWTPGRSVETIPLLLQVGQQIQSSFQYFVREEPGVQSPSETLSLGTGSCRDFANLFLATVRKLGLAARFVSGYLVTGPSDFDYGATHAWAEVYVPGAGWKGFDPTVGIMTGADHIPVAVGRLPEELPPIEGTYSGFADSNMDVGVWLTPL